MPVEEVDGYQRRLNGRLIQVKDHERQQQDVTTAGLDVPGRPPMAGKPAKYANGRALPGVWIDPNKAKDAAAKIADEAPLPTSPKEEPKDKKKVDVHQAVAKTARAVEAMAKIVQNKKDTGGK